jgi:hypothetical protein
MERTSALGRPLPVSLDRKSVSDRPWTAAHFGKSGLRCHSIPSTSRSRLPPAVHGARFADKSLGLWKVAALPSVEMPR